MDIEDVLFWSLAVVQVLLSVRFSALMYQVRPRLHRRTHFALARGQFKDGLLVAVLFGTLCLSKGTPFLKDLLDVSGAFVLAWLISRTVKRLHLL